MVWPGNIFCPMEMLLEVPSASDAVALPDKSSTVPNCSGSAEKTAWQNSIADMKTSRFLNFLPFQPCRVKAGDSRCFLPDQFFRHNCTTADFYHFVARLRAAQQFNIALRYCKLLCKVAQQRVVGASLDGWRSKANFQCIAM